jgi:AICAR transformylase/IMP cyclohydrolase PurH
MGERMADAIKIRRALLSVYDKTGLVDFARALHDEFGIELISTGGTAKALKDAGLPVTLVEELTGVPEMLDGRVKTLHPRIHAAILADRDNPEHMRQIKEQGIEPIDMVVVNLYPFEQTIARPGCTFEEAIEMIDIGGPCLLRAAAKNHRHVLPVRNPWHYKWVLSVLRGDPDTMTIEEWSEREAFFVFGATEEYDAAIWQWLGGYQEDGAPTWFAKRYFTESLLRYGENPHQVGKLLSVDDECDQPNLVHAAVPRAGEYTHQAQASFSFNNFLDASAAAQLCAELARAVSSSAKLSFAPPEGSSAKLRFAPPEGSSARLRFAPADPDSPAPSQSRFPPVREEHRSRRNLPHWQVGGATYWVTFASRIGVLAPAERDIVMAALRYWDGKRLDLHAAVVMADHVHAILTPRALPDRPGEFENLSGLLKSIKSFSGREISQLRAGIGQAWMHESHDRWLRSADEFREKWCYLAQNVVKESLAPTPEQYRWWYAVDYFGMGVGVPLTPNMPRPPILEGKTELSCTGKAELGTGEAGKAEPCSTEGGKAEPCTTDVGKAELCTTGVVCFIKHTNACGVAVDADPVAAYRRAYLGDPNAAMGGILAIDFAVTPAFAEVVMETYARWGKAAGVGGFFVEVWLAPAFDEQAVKIIRGEVEGTPKKEWGRRVRLLAVGDMSRPPDPNEMDFKRIVGGMLMQTRDLVGLNEEQWKVVTQRQPTETEMNDLRLAWLICKHTKSNAITICKDGALIGNGAGQMSRVMSCRIATWLAHENEHGEQLKGAVAASDAFFPFRDGPDILAEAGVTALIQPGGSKRDADVIAACNERGVAMLFTGTRHFKH